MIVPSRSDPFSRFTAVTYRALLTLTLISKAEAEAKMHAEAKAKAEAEAKAHHEAKAKAEAEAKAEA